MTNKTSGNVFIVAAPSGGGKTSLVQALVDEIPNAGVSISHTTRPIRHGETEGQDYFFMDESKFMSMVTNNEFTEHAKVFDYYYGSSTAQIKDRLEQGIDIFLDIDWQGAVQIRKIFPEAVSIFIIPPSLESLEQRLTVRGRDSDAIIQSRMKQAQDEMSHYPEFDYLIINDAFEQALSDLESIITAKRLTIARQTKNQAKLLSILLS